MIMIKEVYIVLHYPKWSLQTVCLVGSLGLVGTGTLQTKIEQ